MTAIDNDNISFLQTDQAAAGPTAAASTIYLSAINECAMTANYDRTQVEMRSISSIKPKTAAPTPAATRRPANGGKAAPATAADATGARVTATPKNETSAPTSNSRHGQNAA